MSRSAGPKLLRTYGKVLRRRRKAARLTQEEFLSEVQRLGLKVPNRTTISSLENGHEEPRLGMLFKLARVFGIRPSEMLRDVEDEIFPFSERQLMDRGRDAKVAATPPAYKTKRRLKRRQPGMTHSRH